MPCTFIWISRIIKLRVISVSSNDTDFFFTDSTAKRDNQFIVIMDFILAQRNTNL